MLFFLAAAAAQPQPGDVTFYKDWYAACDNAPTCETGSLGWTDGAYVRIIRTPWPDDDIEISVVVQNLKVDMIALKIDGERVATGALNGENVYVVDGEQTLDIARKLVRGNVLTIVDANAENTIDPALARISLSGSAAAMRYLDQKQGKAGTRNAFAAIGRKKDDMTAALLPVVQRQIPPEIKDLPKKKQLMKLAETAGCTDRVNDDTDQVFPLARNAQNEQIIAIVACWSGAYNFVSKVFIGERPVTDDDADWRFKDADFDFQPGGSFSLDGSAVMVNAFFNTEEGILGNHAKARGVGDCGASQSYVWDGRMFRLIEATDMPECKGVWQWPVVWRAKVETAGS